MNKKYVMFHHNLKLAITKLVAESMDMDPSKLSHYIQIDSLAEAEYELYLENVKLMGEDGAIEYIVAEWEDEMQ